MMYRAPVHVGPRPRPEDWPEEEEWDETPVSSPGMIVDGDVVPVETGTRSVTYGEGWAWVEVASPLDPVPDGWEEQ